MTATLEKPVKRTFLKKTVDIVELTLAVPQQQLNELRQIAMKYILDHNDQDTALKLIYMTNVQLKQDVKVWKN